MKSEARIMDLAQHARDAIPVVHGIATARVCGSGEDAALLLHRYLEEAMDKGLSMPQAWTALFSSSMLVLGEAVDIISAGTGSTPQQVMVSMALTHAQETS